MRTPTRAPRLLRPPTRLLLASTLACAAVLTACGGSDNQEPAEPVPPLALRCDDALKTAFQYEHTTVLAVKQFAKGELLSLSTPPQAGALTAQADLCFVKLLVGPGNPGPADAPSTSAGIGVQIWLPSKSAWDQRLKAVGGGGFLGGLHAEPTVVSTIFGRNDHASGLPYAERRSIGVENDKGHGPSGSGAFAMNPDGSINKQGWADFERANHESVVRAKHLAKLYYGDAPKFSYFIGASSGGREGLKMAQKYPNDFNGIHSAVPAINWSGFTIAELYPALVVERDLGGVYPTEAQFATVEQAALNSCDAVGGVHLGYVNDPSQCRYDPEKDPDVLCVGSGGVNTTPGCVSSVQARAFNKFWYGPTSDGSVPDPAIDNGWTLSGAQRWYGTPRGTVLSLARAPFSVGLGQIALSLQDATLAGADFLNASGHGADRWKNLSYADFSRAFDRGTQLQDAFSHVDTNNPDLAAFKAANGKIVGAAHLADELIMTQGVLGYYDQVVKAMGGLGNTQSFYKLYIVPGAGHGTPVGSSNREALVPLPTTDRYVEALQNWVEQGIAPTTLTVSSASSAAQPIASTAPLCIYPAKRSYVAGNPLVATSYICQ